MRLYLEGFKFSTHRPLTTIYYQTMKAMQKEESFTSYPDSFPQASRFLFNCDISNMDRHYSTSEPIKHDETTRAPGCDCDATAFELDPSAMAPKVCKKLVRNKKLCDQRYRLYLRRSQKYSTITHVLKFTVTSRSLLKNALSPTKVSSLDLNGH